MKKTLIMLAALGLASSALAQDVSPDTVQAYIKSSWKSFDRNPKGVGPDWAGRLNMDETQKICSETKNQPSAEQGNKIIAAAKASIKYPADGKYLGNWKNGEKLAQEGRGMRYNDKPEHVGGNCYACHQIDKAELSYGTIGPSLAEYGKIRKFSEAETKATYEKIYNAHIILPCSNMPRFGTNGVLSIENIKDLVALLMDKDSPVNK